MHELDKQKTDKLLSQSVVQSWQADVYTTAKRHETAYGMTRKQLGCICFRFARSLRWDSETEV